MIGVRDGQRVIHWPGVAFRILVVLAVSAPLVYAVNGAAGVGTFLPVFFVVISIWLGIKCLIDWAQPIEKLPCLDEPSMDAPSATGGRLVQRSLAGGLVVLAIWFGLHLLLKPPGFFERNRNRVPVIQVSATTARKGDIGVHLESLGTVESSNSMMFTIPEDYCQAVIRKFDARQVLAVEAYDARWEKRFGRGFLTGMDNRIDTATGTLKCRASLVPEGENLMVPGLFLNIRLLLEVKHNVTLVPTNAVLYDPQGAFAWVIRADHSVTRRPLAVGTIDGKWAEIQRGLAPGEVVVSGGGENLWEGLVVPYNLAPMAEPAPDSAATSIGPPPALISPPTSANTGSPQDDEEKAAVSAAQAWLALIDGGGYYIK